jgi:hypothetical protein
VSQAYATRLTVWINTLLKRLRDENFYGSIQFDFRNGVLVLVRRMETIKPPEALLDPDEKSSD